MDEGTPQPETAGETVDSIAEAAHAFKVSLGQVDPRPRDEAGRFARVEGAETEPQEIEAEDEAEPEGEAEAEAESHDEAETDEAAEEAQPESVDLPTSWPSEQVELWKSLPPEAQAVIAEREGQRDAAVNAKFQEAANLRKANEAEINEAKANRERFAQMADFALSLVAPQKPPRSMLDPSSGDYNPDAYHLASAQYDEAVQVIQSIAQQRESIRAQQEQEEQTTAQQRRAQIEERHQPLLLKDVPALADPAKQDTAVLEIARYAIANGVPEHFFTDPAFAGAVTSADLHLAWKAMQYDKMKAAQATVKPKAAKPAAPAVRPGVTTSRSAVEHANRKRDFDRLARTGSIEDGAAAFRHFMK